MLKRALYGRLCRSVIGELHRGALQLSNREVPFIKQARIGALRRALFLFGNEIEGSEGALRFAAMAMSTLSSLFSAQSYTVAPLYFSEGSERGVDGKKAGN